MVEQEMPQSQHPALLNEVYQLRQLVCILIGRVSRLENRFLGSDNNSESFQADDLSAASETESQSEVCKRN
jgi:hypothetical protein